MHFLRALLLVAFSALLLTACGGSESDFVGTGSNVSASGPTMAKAMGTTTVGSWQVTATALSLLPGGTVASARAINDLGKVVGTATDSTYAIQRVLWDVSGGLTVAPVVGYAGSGTMEPTGLNDLGELVGIHRISASQRQADYWAGQGYYAIALMPLAGGSPYLTTARAINANGRIVGSSPNSAGVISAVAWQRNGAPLALGIAGEGLGVNKWGHVVGVTGDSLPRAFLWRDGSRVDLVSPAGSSSSVRAVAVSDTGYIAGTSDNGTVAVRWSYNVDGSGSVSVVALPLPSDLVQPAPAAVNAAGDIVGTAYTANFGRPRAILWRSGQAIPLASYDSRAYSINSAGQIVGDSDANGDGRNEAIVWTVTSGTTTSPPPPVVSTTTNTTPTATIAVNTTSLKIGATLNVAGSFQDPDQGPWSYTIDWGDGQKLTGSATAAGTVNASHAYAAASKKGYKVVFTVTDAAGASASASKIVKVSR